MLRRLSLLYRTPPVATVPVLEALLGIGQLRAKRLTNPSPAENLVEFIDKEVFGTKTKNNLVAGVDRGRLLPPHPEVLDPMQLFLKGVRAINKKSGLNFDQYYLNMLTVSAGDGFGRTEFLRTIATRLDTERPRDADKQGDDGAAAGIDYGALFKAMMHESFTKSHSTLQEMYGKDQPEHRPVLETVPPADFARSVVVMRATFDEPTPYQFQFDIWRRIVKRTIARMLNEYFDIAATYNSDGVVVSSHQFLDSEMNYKELATFMRKFVAATKNNHKYSSEGPSATVVILCIDGLDHIYDACTRKVLLDRIPTLQQAEIMSGRPTFLVVSSSNLDYVLDTWTRAPSSRSIFAIPLPAFLPSSSPAREALRDHLCNQHPRVPAWSEYVTAMLDFAGGHPGTLHNQVGKILATSRNPSLGPQDLRCYDDEQQSADNNIDGRVALAIWKRCFHCSVVALNMLVPPCEVSYLDRVKDQDKTSLAALVKNNAMSFTVPNSGFLEKYCFLHNSNRVNVLLVATPLEFFRHLQIPTLQNRSNNKDKDKDKKANLKPEDIALLSNAQRIRTAVWTYSNDNSCTMVWQAGIVAALALSARARADRSLVDPTLSELFPTAVFCNEELKQWRVPIQSRYRICDVDSEASLWSAGERRSNIKKQKQNNMAVDDDILARLWNDNQEATLSSTIELVDHEKRRAVGGICLLHTSSARDAAAEHSSTAALSLVKDDKRAAGATRASCVLLFCDGDDVQSSTVELQGKNIVLIGADACKALLAPFGASVLLQKLQRRSP